MKEVLTVSAVALSVASPALSDKYRHAPEDYEKAWVAVYDNAENGCWTNIGEVQTYAEDQMRLVGFNVVDRPETKDGETDPVLEENGIELVINVVGERLNSGLCVGFIQTTFNGTMVNPNRDKILILNPVGIDFSPWSVWSSKNLNNYVLDYVKFRVPDWVEDGVIEKD